MIGKEILGYHVDEKIGSGGFGTVYKVSKTNAAGTYIRALKHITLPTKKQYASVLNSMGGDYAKADDYFADALQDIVNEIKILSTLSESGVNNIVRYYENDIIETVSPKMYDIYILMEYLTPFDSYVESKTLTVRDVISLGKDISQALVSCHEKNIIHRDIKDDNIFVSPEGNYKLGDFGVSKALKDKSRAESVKGTPNFIAPEVYLGKEKYDNTVDVYSLGIVLYKILNKMRNPFLPAFPAPYNTLDEDVAFEARMTGKIPELPISAQNELGNVILKAIMPRTKRYDSAKEFLEALEKAEKQMDEEELEMVVHEPSVPLEEHRLKNNTMKSASSADETIAMNYAFEEEETKEEEDRHLFDTFAVTPNTFIEEGNYVTATQKNGDDEIVLMQNSVKEESKNNGNKTVHDVKKKKSNVRKVAIFSLPPVLLILYIAFYVLLIPALYGTTLSFFDWLFADVEHILEFLKDANNVLVPVYSIVLLVILQYVLLGALATSLFFVAKELHHPKENFNEAVKYTGKMPRIILEDLIQEIKNRPDVCVKNDVDVLKTVIESMRYSKEFGVSGDSRVIVLENEICNLIVEIHNELSAEGKEGVNKMSECIATLKKKTALRDNLLKR